jgi:hypothetical protein
MKRLLSLMVVSLLLAACQVLGGGSGDDNNAGSSSETIRWDRNPHTVVFRAKVVGGEFEDSFFSRNEIPYCTIFGDNRIVWSIDTGISDSQVLIDRLTDIQIRAFVSALTVEERIYTYGEESGYLPPSEVSPVVETITLAVNDTVHTTDAFSDWPPDYFQKVLEYCYALGQAPVEFEPDAAWISAQEIPYNPRVPSVMWDGDAAGLSLAELAVSGERRWVTDNNVKILWQLIRRTAVDLQFSENDKQYVVAVEVPDISPDAPPAPEEQK